MDDGDGARACYHFHRLGPPRIGSLNAFDVGIRSRIVMPIMAVVETLSAQDHVSHLKIDGHSGTLRSGLSCVVFASAIYPSALSSACFPSWDQSPA
ncbi:MAG: hypothetical protein WD425_19045 [Nitrospirales bacterium]